MPLILNAPPSIRSIRNWGPNYLSYGYTLTVAMENPTDDRPVEACI